MSRIRIIIIVGAGELGRAVGLFLTQYTPFEATYFMLDKNLFVSEDAAGWITNGNTRGRFVKPLVYDVKKVGDSFIPDTFSVADIVIDCLPFALAPYAAQLACRLNSAYVSPGSSALGFGQPEENIMATGSPFLFQAGIVPGLATLLLKDLYEYYRGRRNGKRIDYSGIRVATLPAEAETDLPEAGGQSAFLSCKEAILNSNIRYPRKNPLTIWECNEMSGNYTDYSIMAGGEVNLLDALTSRLRQPSHVMQLRSCHQKKAGLPLCAGDWLKVQAVIEGYTGSKTPVTLLKTCKVDSARVGREWLAATQVCRAVLLAECAQLLLTTRTSGLIFLNQMDARLLLRGSIVKRFFDIDPEPEVTYHYPAASGPSD
jgi:hypothetical protein